MTDLTDPSPLSPEVGMVEQAPRDVAEWINFSASVIKSGEPWTKTCQSVHARAVSGFSALVTLLDDMASRDLKPAASGGLEWRPIETAPKDGTMILVAHNRAAFDACWQDGAWIDGATDNYDDPVSYHPTHWMPLPTPPDSSADEAQPAPSTPPQVEREGSRDDLEALDLDAMEKVAREANDAAPGGWTAKWEAVGDEEGGGVTGYEPTGKFYSPAGWVSLDQEGPSVHVQTFDPPTVLRLIATSREAGKIIAALLEAWPADSVPSGKLCVRAANFLNSTARSHALSKSEGEG